MKECDFFFQVSLILWRTKAQAANLSAFGEYGNFCYRRCCSRGMSRNWFRAFKESTWLIVAAWPSKRELDGDVHQRFPTISFGKLIEICGFIQSVQENCVLTCWKAFKTENIKENIMFKDFYDFSQFTNFGFFVH